MISGIRALADIKLRCRCDEGGCWIWSMSASQSRGRPEPRVWLADEKRTTTIGEAVWLLSGRPPVQRRWRTCFNTLCGNPAHIMGGTPADWGRWVSESGVLRGCSIRDAANKARAKRRRALSDDQIRHVMQSNDTGRALSLQLGVSESVISRYRRGQQPPLAKGASVFSWAAR